MKRTIAILIALLAVPAFASESFILNIPIRFNPQQETGKVRIWLDLSAAPAGAQLVVNGTTTLNLGDTQTINGDSVAFAAGTGNQVVITYQPLSNFAGDFCQAPNSTEKNVPMRFAGAQDVVDYRMATYIVASPAVECSQPSKHTGDTPATLTPQADGVAPALNAINKGRNTFDVGLVLDKSGSMADLPPQAVGGATKIAILHSAVDAFVGNWEQLDQPTPDGADWSGDRLSLVAFDAVPTASTFPDGDPPANVFVHRGNSMTVWDEFITADDALAPGSTTSIGGGINKSMQQWKADPKNDLSLVVVTDGMQNTPPMITPTASGYLGLDPVSGLPQELRQRFIPIQTIGFGVPATVDQTLLTNIAYETSGVSFIDVNATTMFNSFALTLIQILKGNTASIGVQRTETLATKPLPPQTVFVDKSAQRVVFSLQWEPPFANALDIDVFKPGSATPAVPFSSKKLPQASIKTFNLKPSDAGAWTYRVRRTKKGMERRLPYTVNAFFLERLLDFELSSNALRAVAGDKLTIRAVVDWDHKRLVGLPPGSIRARVLRPTEGLGNILHETRADVHGGTVSGDPLKPLDLKLKSFKGDTLLSRVTPKPVETITLTEESKGIYAGTLEKTNVPGVYAFEVVLDWDNERAGHVHREERLERLVSVKADPARTEVVVDKSVNGVARVHVTPRDRFGNYLGPGFASSVKMKLESAGVVRSAVPDDPQQTGTYVFEIGDVPSGETPKVMVAVE